MRQSYSAASQVPQFVPGDRVLVRGFDVRGTVDRVFFDGLVLVIEDGSEIRQVWKPRDLALIEPATEPAPLTNTHYLAATGAVRQTLAQRWKSSACWQILRTVLSLAVIVLALGTLFVEAMR